MVRYVTRSLAGPVEQLEQAAAGLAASFVDGSFCDAGLGCDFTRAEALQGQPQDFLPAGRERGEKFLRDKVVQLGLACLLLGIVRQPWQASIGWERRTPRLRGVPFPRVSHLVEHDRYQERPEDFVVRQVEFRLLEPTPMSTLRMADAATSESAPAFAAGN